MNTVILTSVLSAGNHALYAGTRVLYGLSVIGQGPRIFVWTTRAGVPLPALLATASISLLCFGSSFIGSGQLWGWLQNIVGVSNQVRLLAADVLSVKRRVYTCIADCMVIYWTCQLEIQEGLGPTGQTIGRIEVPSRMDLALGSDVCCE
jgi:hypothetical protein